MGFNSNLVDSPYDSYGATYQWLWDTGIVQSGIGGKNIGGGIGGQGASSQRAPSVICAANAPCGRLVVKFTAARSGYPPDVPHPDPGFPGMWLASAALILSPPSLQEDSTNRMFVVQGEYVYLLEKPVWVEDEPTMGMTPYDDGNDEVDGMGTFPKFNKNNFKKELWGSTELKTL